MTSPYIIYLLLFAAATVAALLKKLTIAGAAAGLIVAALIYAAGGVTGVFSLAVFFVLGSGASTIGLKRKQMLGLAEENKGQRTMWQVLANGGVAAILSAASLVIPGLHFPVTLLICGSLAAATADTLSSELGNIYGKRFYNIITFEKDTRGLDGVVSLEGTLSGILGAAVIAIIYFSGTDDLMSATFVFLAGTIGTLIDSILGATLERRGLIGNNAVNFLNTLTGAATAWLLCVIF
ncbi:DUF92 domain-containing protein [Mucilaginibacter ginkgonis]|uniref:DUF92 domain-containing protein n=1 Tax=Mucilaginibacter ginkgonis TaxID=2682091 RepID=A0A6I4I093_9SPHI|nr:DUF92 domain-containing protein [Mucilaginibacter ginkgonis]QQL49770.1 DUF92 domain-containing protein [Mucilaginibacter ginkgonis]